MKKLLTLQLNFKTKKLCKNRNLKLFGLTLFILTSTRSGKFPMRVRLRKFTPVREMFVLICWKRLPEPVDVNKYSQANSFTFFMQQNIHIAQIIQQKLTAEGRNISWLCCKLNWQRQKYYRFLNNNLIDVNDLYNISVILNHNFFQYYSHLFSNQTDLSV